MVLAKIDREGKRKKVRTKKQKNEKCCCHDIKIGKVDNNNVIREGEGDRIKLFHVLIASTVEISWETCNSNGKVLYSHSLAHFRASYRAKAKAEGKSEAEYKNLKILEATLLQPSPIERDCSIKEGSGTIKIVIDLEKIINPIIDSKEKGLLIRVHGVVYAKCEPGCNQEEGSTTAKRYFNEFKVGWNGSRPYVIR